MIANILAIIFLLKVKSVLSSQKQNLIYSIYIYVSVVPLSRISKTDVKKALKLGVNMKVHFCYSKHLTKTKIMCTLLLQVCI